MKVVDWKENEGKDAWTIACDNKEKNLADRMRQFDSGRGRKYGKISEIKGRRGAATPVDKSILLQER